MTTGLKAWGAILMSPGFEGEIIPLESSSCKVFIAIVDPSDAECNFLKTQEIARQIFANGAQMIELSSDFGFRGADKVIEVVNCPVGTTFFGPECRPCQIQIDKEGLQDWAYFFRSPGFGQGTQHEFTSVKSKVIVVGFDPATPEVGKFYTYTAFQLINLGVQRIELCGGFGPRWVTDLMNVARERKKNVSIGGVYYPPEFSERMLEILIGNSVRLR